VAPRKPKTRKRQTADQVFGGNGVFYKFPQGVEGPIEIRFDFTEIPPPDKYYYADCLYLRVDREMRMAILSFGHRNENTDKFSDRIDVAMPANSLFGTFCASAKSVEDAVDKIPSGTPNTHPDLADAMGDHGEPMAYAPNPERSPAGGRSPARKHWWTCDVTGLN
jgi:hypothetical protein